MRDLSEVGRLVTRRRLELGMDAAQLARDAGVDPKTLASLEHGERWPRDRSRASIETALRWAAGSLDDMRAGQEPKLIEAGNDPLSTYSVEFLLDYTSRRAAAELAAARTTDPQYGKGRSDQGEADGEESQDPRGMG